MKTLKVKLNELIIDEEFVRLRKVNPMYVSRYRQAYRIGATMPLIVINEDTSVIVAGNHRYEALVEEYGLDYEVEVIPKSFDSRADELIEFAGSNASHGNALGGTSRRAIAKAMAKAGVQPEEISMIFDVTVKKVISWGEVNTVKVGKGPVKTVGGEKVFEKVEEEPHKIGPDIDKEKVIPVKQYEEHWKKDMSGSASTHMQQLIRWFNNGWIKPKTKTIIAAETLLPLLDEFVSEGVDEVAEA